MADIIRKRLTGREEGFTLIELLVVIVILGILLAIAVPSYMGFRDRAQITAAQANVRAAVPAVEAYYQDHNAYADAPTDTPPGVFSLAGLRTYDSGLKLTTVNSVASGTSYCIADQQGTHWAGKAGPDQEITKDSNPCAAAP